MPLIHEKTVTVEGLSELQDALSALPRATSKNVLKRVLIKRAAPIVSDAKANVRVDSGRLKKSIGVGSKLTRRQSELHRQESGVEVFIGAGGLVQAITEEFGTAKQDPHPFLRPAWDANKSQLLDEIARDLWSEIEKSAARLAKRVR